MGKTNNFPTKEIENLSTEQVCEMTKCLNDLRNKGKPKTNAELRERIDEYFMFCQSRGWRPGFESLALALNVSRQTVFYWCRGENCDNERMEIMQVARQTISSFLEQCLLSGRISPPSGIFLAKNWLNYRDQISIEQALPELPKRKIGTIDDIKQLMIDSECKILETESEGCNEEEN